MAMRIAPLSLTRVSRWLFILAMLTITWLALWPTDTQVITTGWDKTNHLLAFFVLLFLADAGWPKPCGLVYKIGGLLLFGLLIEVCQATIPMRYFSLWDLLADALGMGCYLPFRSPLQMLWSKLQGLPFIERDTLVTGGGSCSDYPGC